MGLGHNRFYVLFLRATIQSFNPVLLSQDWARKLLALTTLREQFATPINIKDSTAYQSDWSCRKPN